MHPAKFFPAGMITLLIISTQALAQYAGSERCADCHPDAYQQWRASHHWQAMQAATEATVLGDFDHATITHYRVTSTFFKKGGDFFVRTDNADGELQTFPISYTFGFYPLQQYLIGFDDGRYQALSVAWDSRPASEGGQRWFHLYPDEAIPHDDLLHWTGAFQNWNTRCASCHSTNLEKNYQQSSDTFDTRWSEINVACEACHGPAAAHVQWATRERIEDTPDPTAPAAATGLKGLTTMLSARGDWQHGSDPTRALVGGSGQQRQLAACAGCHSRRQELTHPDPSRAVLDQYSPSLLLDGLYYPDGQIDDEVYVYGSFLQSKMHAAGVVCGNCHEPHSLKLRAEGNALCAQCHDPGAFDQRAHHHHPMQSTGAQCVNCHMPARDYMLVDPRRDHSFRVPQPMLSDLFGSPNACTGCHQDRDNSWAVQSLQQWLGHQPLRDEHTATLSIARANNPAALRPLIDLSRSDAAPILRATALQESGRFPSSESIANATEQLYDEHGLVRLGAVRALEALPHQQRYPLLAPLIDEPLKAVRMGVAGALADVDDNALTEAQRAQLSKLFEEYERAQRYNADMPNAQLNLGVFYSQRGEPAKAQQAYQHALNLAPDYLPALLNLADHYRNQQRDDKAKPLLQRAIDTAPAQAPAHHAMGLLLVRQRQLPLALPYLQRAAELAPETARYGYVYGVALHSIGQIDQAIALLTELAAEHPQQQQIQRALQAYRHQGGQP